MRRLVVFGIIFVLVSGAVATAVGLTTLLSGEASPPVLEPAPTPVPAEPGPTPIPKPDQFNEKSVPIEPKPWPEGLPQEIISLALKDPQTQEMLEGHRYRVFGVSPFRGKSGPCDSTGSFPPPLNCAHVGIYDYTVATGVMVTVDIHKKEVVDRFMVPEFQPPPLKEEFAEIARIIAEDPRFGPSVEVVPAHGQLVVDIDLGGNCGALSPQHRCLLVYVRQAGGESSSVTVDMVDLKVVRIDPN